MKIQDALQALRDYYDKPNKTEDDEFLFTEALGYLIEETKNPQYMTELAWHYCSKKRFDIEIKYLEMAAEYGYIPAIEELGYMWYYGQHGEKDYKKAFAYFSRGAEGDPDHMGSLWCRYKLADMYRFGCGVEKDEEKYRQMIEEAEISLGWIHIIRCAMNLLRRLRIARSFLIRMPVVLTED